MHRGLTWTDLDSPTPEEVQRLIETHDIHPVIGEELLKPSFKPKVELYGNYIYLILHFPSLHRQEGEHLHEIDFIIGEHFIITTHYSDVDPLNEFSKIFEVNSIIDREGFGDHAGYVFFYMIKHLYQKMNEELEYIEDVLLDIEESIFEGNEKDMVRAISMVSRELLHFKQATSLHTDVLDSFEEAGRRFFGEEFAYPLRAILGETRKIHTLIRSHIDTLEELRSTNNSLLTTKQNEIMKVLTIMAFVTFPLSLIASVFGMNTDYLPIVGIPGDFWIVIGGMTTLTLIFFIFFKYKKWL